MDQNTLMMDLQVADGLATGREDSKTMEKDGKNQEVNPTNKKQSYRDMLSGRRKG